MIVCNSYSGFTSITSKHGDNIFLWHKHQRNISSVRKHQRMDESRYVGVDPMFKWPFWNSCVHCLADLCHSFRVSVQMRWENWKWIPASPAGVVSVSLSFWLEIHSYKFQSSKLVYGSSLRTSVNSHFLWQSMWCQLNWPMSMSDGRWRSCHAWTYEWYISSEIYLILECRCAPTNSKIFGEFRKSRHRMMSVLFWKLHFLSEVLKTIQPKPQHYKKLHHEQRIIKLHSLFYDYSLPLHKISGDDRHQLIRIYVRTRSGWLKELPSLQQSFKNE